MFRMIICALALFLTLHVCAAAPAFAFQNKKLVFVIENASFRRVVVPGKTSIVVEFANTLNEDEVLLKDENWRVRVVEQNGDVRNLIPSGVEIIEPPNSTRMAVVTVDEAFDLDK